MSRVLAIAGNTVREALRERLLYNLVVFAIVLTTASLTISRLTLGEQYRIIADMATSSTQVFGILISVFLGVALVSREIERRTCYAMLARPVSRGGFILGKSLGLLATAGLNLLIMALVSAVVLYAYLGNGRFLGPSYFAVFGLMLAQFAVCISFAALFASFSSPTLAIIFTLSVVAAGFLFSEVRAFWLLSDEVHLKELVRVLDYTIPNMGLLDVKEALTYGDPVSFRSFAARAAYGFGYAGLVTALASLVFSRRDIR